MTAYLPTRRGPVPPLSLRSQSEPPPGPARQASIVERATAILSRATAVTRPGLSPSSIVEAARSSLPWRHSAAVSAGARTALSISIENQDEQPVELTFHISDLTDDRGHTMLGSVVTFNPPTQTVPPYARARIDIEIAVPLRTPSGSYSGLVQGVGLPDVKAVLSVEVV